MAALCKNSVLRNDSSQSLIDRRFISLVKAPLTIVRSEIPRLQIMVDKIHNAKS